MKIFSLRSFLPAYRFHKVKNIRPGFLKSMGIKGVIVDKDETLIMTGMDSISQEVRTWVKEVQKTGIKIVIISNSTRRNAVKIFAERLKVPYVLAGPAYIYGKPWPAGFKKALKLLGTLAYETVVVDDQLTTGILGGNCFGLLTILVAPIGGKDRLITRITGRQIEKRIIKILQRDKLFPDWSDS